MEKYYVSGCKGQDDDIVTCNDSEAEFWTLYQRMADGTSQGIIDLKFREDAEAAMAVYIERDALQQKLDAISHECGMMMGLLNDISRYHEECTHDDMMHALIPLEYVSAINGFVDRDVNGENPCPLTDKFLKAVREEGVENHISSEDFKVSVAVALARLDGCSDDNLDVLIWERQPPEPCGSVLEWEYYPRANQLIAQLRANATKGGSDDLR